VACPIPLSPGGEGITRGGNGKGARIHSLTAAAEMPLATCRTLVKGEARAQLVPLLDAVRLRNSKREHPRKRPRVIATGKGYDATALYQQLRTRGIRAQLSNGSGRAGPRVGDQSRKTSDAFNPTAPLPGSRESIVGCRPLGTSRGLLQRVSRHGDDPFLDQRLIVG
jgi:hypothetical protein